RLSQSPESRAPNLEPRTRAPELRVPSPEFFRYSSTPVIVLKTIDAHVGGEPLRLIVEGFPAPRGKSLIDKRDWANRHADQLRRLLMLEPRGHRDMSGAVFTEPTSPGSHAGVLFMNGDGFSLMCGHGIIAVATIALERGIIVPGGDGTSLALDTAAGTVRASAIWRDGQDG